MSVRKSPGGIIIQSAFVTAAPTLINTFLEAYDFSGKKIVLFASSGGSGFGNTAAELKPSAPGAEIVEAKVVSRVLTEAKINALIDACKE